MAKVVIRNDEFHVRTEFWDNQRAKDIPDRKWSPAAKAWIAPINASNARYFKRAFTGDETSILASSKITQLINTSGPIQENFPPWFKFKPGITPMAHQKVGLDQAWQKPEFGLFMWMGTGKTFVAINLASAYYINGDIDALLVICPTSIKPVWKMEFEKFCTIDTDIHVLESGRHDDFKRWNKKETDNVMKVLVIGTEAFSQGNGALMANMFADTHTTFAVVDESSKIKNYKSIRTECIIAVGLKCTFRIILTGTPVTQGIHDLFAQCRFLNWEILGHKSYFSFRNRYCTMGGFENKEIIGYENVPELIELLKPYVYIVNKGDALDLPPKIYQQRIVEPSPNQKKAIKELGDLMRTEIEGVELEVKEILERMTRYQQIVGGNLPFLADEENHIYDTMPMPGKNPKMEELMNIIGEYGGKMIIWARFKPEIYEIEKRLTKMYGAETVLSYHGDVDTAGRETALRRFEDPDDPSRFFVSNQQTGGMGVTLNQSWLTVYYSNTFSYQDRAQSEDRNHRKGQEHTVTYIDIILNHKEDKRIVTALARKQSMAEYVNAELRK